MVMALLGAYMMEEALECDVKEEEEEEEGWEVGGPTTGYGALAGVG